MQSLDQIILLMDEIYESSPELFPYANKQFTECSYISWAKKELIRYIEKSNLTYLDSIIEFELLMNRFYNKKLFIGFKYARILAANILNVLECE